MQEYGPSARVEVQDTGFGTVIEAELYPDGDVRFYVVRLDNGSILKCAGWELFPEQE